MPLHLLHHKKWNVYNQDNQDRVRKDEEKQKLEDKAKNQQKLAVDSELRLERLRSRNRERRGDVDLADADATKGGHPADLIEEPPAKPFNLFEKEEHLRGQTNMHAQLAKKKELDTLERKNTNWHLDTGTQDTPWYSSAVKPAKLDTKRKSRDDSRKDKGDPLRNFEQNVKSSSSDTKVIRSVPPPRADESHMDRLRREKFEREQGERERKRKLLNKQRPSPY